jgi:RNA polymerase sigma factor (sigma-70 family)
MVPPAPIPRHDEPPAESPDDRRVRLGVLLDQVRGGHRPALDEIVQELTPLLWQVARSRGLDRAASEDVVQSTWLCLLRDLHTIHTPEALTGWLVTVARREAGRAKESVWREAPVSDPPETSSDADPAAVTEERMSWQSRRHAVWAAVERLPHRCRELLRVVAFVDRPDYDAVALALGMPRGSIGPTRGRCLGKLREALATQPDWRWP